MSLYSDAREVIAGGVNSPVRAFAGVGGEPVFFRSASGAWVESEDGRRFIDYVGSWGPMILGHAHPAVLEAVIETAQRGLSFGAPCVLETRIATKITDLMPSIERLRMVSSGTEATMSAIRLARGYTGRDKIVKFEGCYHGHSDSLLIKAGSGALTRRTRRSYDYAALQRRRCRRTGIRQVRGRYCLRHRRTHCRQYEHGSARPRFPRDAARCLQPQRCRSDIRRSHDRVSCRQGRRTGPVRHRA